VQRREGERGLDLEPLRPQQGRLTGARLELVEQRRLADTGLAADDQRPRGALTRPLEKRSQELPLRLATDQHATKIHRAARRSGRSNPGHLTGATWAA
jgi:hypothetical protein